MNKFVLALLLAAACAGCATRYDMTLADGTVITAKGRPHLNKEKTAWIFVNAYGRTNYISAGSVTQVAPRSMDTDNPTQFNPNTQVTTTKYANPGR